MAEQINKLSSDICEQFEDNSQSFTAISVALDERKDQTDNAQLAIFISGTDDKFKVTEELLSLCVMLGCTTAEDMFQQLLAQLSGPVCHGADW